MANVFGDDEFLGMMKILICEMASPHIKNKYSPSPTLHLNFGTGENLKFINNNLGPFKRYSRTALNFPYYSRIFLKVNISHF